MSNFDEWIGRIVDQCCRRESGAVLDLDVFEGLVGLFATREVFNLDRPLRKLNFDVEAGQIFGLRLKTLADYPPNVSPEGSHSKISKAFVTYLLEAR